MSAHICHSNQLIAITRMQRDAFQDKDPSLRVWHSNGQQASVIRSVNPGSAVQ